jgi:HAD superfamily hydrolase (TIGR01549 family)
MESTISYQGIFFDLGNTLIPFTPRDSMEFVVKWYRSAGIDEKQVPFQKFLKAFRAMVRKERDRSAKELWESSIGFRADELTSTLNLKDDGLRERLLSTHSDSFTSCLRMRSSSRYVLDMIRSSITETGERPVLGLISNAMDHEAIRSFMTREGLNQYFDPVIISSEVGMTKPHPEIFQMALERTSLKPERTVYIGDRYLTDVQGSRNAGMKAVYIREYHTAGEPPEGVEVRATTIKNILDLLPILTNPTITDIHG